MEQKVRMIAGTVAGFVLGTFLPIPVVLVVLLGVAGVGAYLWLKNDKEALKKVFGKKEEDTNDSK